MELLEKRILADGKAIDKDVLLVDSFLNNNVDPKLMQAIGNEFAAKFASDGITKVVTIESSGISPAVFAALALGVDMVIMKKAKSRILNSDTVETQVFSFTKNSEYTLTLKKKFIKEGERVLLIDDFLANGEAALGAARLLKECGATIAGMGMVITKSFMPGLAKLKEAGYKVVSLASVSKMDTDTIEFAEE